MLASKKCFDQQHMTYARRRKSSEPPPECPNTWMIIATNGHVPPPPFHVLGVNDTAADVGL